MALIKIPLTHKNSLKKLGYHAHNGVLSRHRALNKAVSKFGKTELVRKLVAVRTLTKNRSPTVSNIYNRDIQWIRTK